MTRFLPLLIFTLLLLPRPAHAVGSCEGDFIDNDIINLSDVSVMNAAYNKGEGDPGYHPRFDLNDSNTVNLSDVSIMGGWYNQPCEGGDFVEAWGQTLYTPENPDYTFTGVNRYNLLTVGSQGCYSSWTEAQIETWFGEIEQQEVEVVRLWLFQDFTEDGFDRFDYLLNVAEDHNVRVIPVLENNWTHCTEGGDKDEDWYNTGYLSPYGDYTLSLKDYAEVVGDRYKNDTRIAMWQIMNEAGPVGTCSSTADETMLAMADDIATAIQAIDVNHLVSFGTMGGGQCGASGDEYETLHALDSIDICEYHDYNDITDPTPGDQWNGLQVRLDQCEGLDKPIFIGEAGMGLVEESITAQQRADYFEAKIGAFYNAGGVGYLIWSYRDVSGSDDLDYGPTDPLAGVVGGY